MTGNVTIARLPKHVRHELNRRLAAGEPEQVTLTWLNAQAEINARGSAERGAAPFAEADLAQWREQGYRDWLLQQEILAVSHVMDEEVAELSPEGAEPLTERLAAWLAVRYVAESRRVRVSTGDAEQDWRRLREFCSDVAGLRRGDQNAEWLKIEWERLEVEKQDSLLRYKKKILVGLETIRKFARRYPKARAAFEALADAVQTPMDKVPGAP